jgi:hypothetical protein
MTRFTLSGTAVARISSISMPMPNPFLKAAEAHDLLKYFHWSDQREGLAKN